MAALGLLALALRLGYLFQVTTTSLVTPEELDPGFYYDWGRQIAAGDWRGTASFVQSPLYAYLLGVLMMFIGADVTRILVFQACVGTGTVLLTYVLGRRLFGHWHGMLAGLLIAFYGPFLFFEGMVMKTFLSPFLTVLLLLVLDVARQEASGGVVTGADGAPPPAPATLGRRATWLFGLGGVVYGLATLDRDNFILLAPALALLALWLGGGLSRRGLRSAAAFTLGTVLMIAPVTLRNWIVSHEFVLLTTGGGEVFFIGNNADANGLYVPPPFVRPDPKYEHADFIARASEIEGRSLSPMESSWFWFREGMRFVMEEPLAEVRLLGRKLVHFWNWYELPDNLDYGIMQTFSPLLRALNPVLPPHPVPTLAVPAGSGAWFPIRIHLLATFGTLAPLGIAGIALTWRRWRTLLPLYVLLFGYMATVMLFFNFSRFRVPIVPILALFAAEGLSGAWRALRRLFDLIAALLRRSGEQAATARALFAGAGGVTAAVLFLGSLAFVNLEYPRGVIPAIEQALIIGNAYYAQGESVKARQSYTGGLVLLGEGPGGP